MRYDFVVIGAGPAGYVAAIRASQLGGRVALIEKECIGGTCLNRGCIPTKALVESATLFRKMREASRYGLVVEGSVRADFAAVMARKDAIVSRIVGSVRELLDARGVEVVAGEARLVAPDRAAVRLPDSSTRELSFSSALIATGSVAARPPLPGIELPGVLDSRQLLGLQELPRRLVVVGASVVGMEMATIFHHLGSQVTVLGRRTFLKSVDPQLARRYRSLAARRGLSITVGLEFDRIETVEGRLRLHYSAHGQTAHVDADAILLATGQTPVTQGLGLEEVGVETDGGGFIRVDSRLRTSVPGIYAAGDVVGGWMLAHVASHEGMVAAENALGGDREIDYLAVPNCVFTDPEIAGVGLTEAEAKAAGYSPAVARFPLSASGRALTMGEEEGLVRLVYDSETGRVLGVHMMGAHASELIGEGALAVKAGLSASDLASTMHQHPTLSECLMEAATAAVCGEGIHYRRV
ncbi:MAG: dihydrolipoyl dehydrogenase [Anaerolineae bacterium]|nr:dihydrolipoyl dehydrogenase [Anaerolineae bacterium]